MPACRLGAYLADSIFVVQDSHLEDALRHLHDGDVKGAAAQVVHRDDALLLVRAVGQRRRRWLVDDAQHLQPRDLARILRRLWSCS